MDIFVGLFLGYVTYKLIKAFIGWLGPTEYPFKKDYLESKKFFADWRIELDKYSEEQRFMSYSTWSDRLISRVNRVDWPSFLLANLLLERRKWTCRIQVDKASKLVRIVRTLSSFL